MLDVLLREICSGNSPCLELLCLRRQLLCSSLLPQRKLLFSASDPLVLAKLAPSSAITMLLQLRSGVYAYFEDRSTLLLCPHFYSPARVAIQAVDGDFRTHTDRYCSLADSA